MSFTKREVKDDNFAHQRFILTNADTGAVLGTFDFQRIIESSDTIGTAANRAFQMPIENFLADEVDPHIKDGTIHTSAAERATFTDKPSNTTFNNAVSSINTALANRPTNTQFNAHTGNTTIHVTQADRNRWDAVPGVIKNIQKGSFRVESTPSHTVTFSETPVEKSIFIVNGIFRYLYSGVGTFGTPVFTRNRDSTSATIANLWNVGTSEDLTAYWELYEFY